MADLLERLPSPHRLRELSIALAILDVAMSPEDDPDDRYFRFDPRDSSGVALASMDNGSGDRYFIAFTEDTVFGWGFSHEYPMNPFARTPVAVWPGLLHDMPAAFEPLTRDARFQLADTFMATAAFWSQGGRRWHTGSVIPPAGEPDPDGAEELFELILDDNPQTFARFAEDYFDVRPDDAAVNAVYRSKPLDPAILAALNPHADYENVRAQLRAMGLSAS
ncbi:hypothetical protein FHX52_0552 [Humibacillus xanthopallidus]|uniref:Uncharacterized protein n=2 Tax=Humibacillus xanthopallidus TaxID=412689 RepID=A0A543PTR2_9MICO|nr:hypothetical protein FHX52_0552 [Humibacillus xanthopallidus]